VASRPASTDWVRASILALERRDDINFFLIVLPSTNWNLHWRCTLTEMPHDNRLNFLLKCPNKRPYIVRAASSMERLQQRQWCPPPTKLSQELRVLATQFCYCGTCSFHKECELKKLDAMGKKNTLFATPQLLSKMEHFFPLPCVSRVDVHFGIYCFPPVNKL
jgi:hypothetical protein